MFGNLRRWLQSPHPHTKELHAELQSLHAAIKNLQDNMQSAQAKGRVSLARHQMKHYPQGWSGQPTSWAFPKYLDNPDCRWLQSLKEAYLMPITFPASLSAQAGLLVYSLIQNLSPRTILEVGVFCGVSTQWMAAALLENGVAPGTGAIIHCFDDFSPIYKSQWRDAEMLSGRYEFVEERLRMAGLLDYCRLHRGDSSSTIVAMQPRLAEAGGVDFAFIDGDHTIPGVVADFRAVEPVLNTGGYLLLHDTYPEQCGNHEGPRHLIDNIHDLGVGSYERVELHISPLNFGMCLMRRVG